MWSLISKIRVLIGVYAGYEFATQGKTASLLKSNDKTTLYSPPSVVRRGTESSSKHQALPAHQPHPASSNHGHHRPARYFQPPTEEWGGVIVRLLAKYFRSCDQKE